MLRIRFIGLGYLNYEPKVKLTSTFCVCLSDDLTFLPFHSAAPAKDFPKESESFSFSRSLNLIAAAAKKKKSYLVIAYKLFTVWMETYFKGKLGSI